MDREFEVWQRRCGCGLGVSMSFGVLNSSPHGDWHQWRRTKPRVRDLLARRVILLWTDCYTGGAPSLRNISHITQTLFPLRPSLVNHPLCSPMSYYLSGSLFLLNFIPLGFQGLPTFDSNICLSSKLQPSQKKASMNKQLL